MNQGFEYVSVVLVHERVQGGVRLGFTNATFTHRYEQEPSDVPDFMTFLKWLGDEGFEMVGFQWAPLDPPAYGQTYYWFIRSLNQGGMRE